jgi:hypothetical protein
MIAIKSVQAKRRIVCLAVAAAVTLLASGEAMAKQASDIVGVWDVSRDQSPRRCKITLNGERSDKGDYFVGVPIACRRAMPIFTKVGRWSLTDTQHLTLSDPKGETILDLVADGDVFTTQGPDGVAYRFAPLTNVGRSITDPDPVGEEAEPPKVIRLGATTGADVVATTAPVEDAGKKHARAPAPRPSEMAGRYAILRDKTRDTGCMLTLDDKTRVKGGDRAALAPACRDQGIVVFDPSAWQIIDGRLVLTAKAGHTTHLDRQADGSWLKDPAEGKSLTLKKF